MCENCKIFDDRKIPIKPKKQRNKISIKNLDFICQIVSDDLSC